MHHDAPEDFKEEFQKTVRYLTAGRFSNRRKPEILPWERIYKVFFKTRPIDRKTKFFENRWYVAGLGVKDNQPTGPLLEFCNHEEKR